jgi:hypothetical protein
MTELEKFIKHTNWKELMEHKEKASNGAANLALFAEWARAAIAAGVMKRALKEQAAMRWLIHWVNELQTAAMKDGHPVVWTAEEHPNHQWSDEHEDLIDTRTGEPIEETTQSNNKLGWR